MEDRTELLKRLRINRGEGSASRTASRRWPMPLAVGAALLLLAGGGAAWYLNAATEAVPVKTAAAAAAQPNSSGPSMGRTQLDASGYVVALRQAQVSANSIYRVAEVLVQAGDVVKQGQVIARLDNSNTHAALEASKMQVRQIEAALAAVKVAAADIQPGFLRNQAQLKEGLISQDAFDTAKAGNDAAQQNVQVAEQNLAVARANVIVNQRYEDTTVIRAPFDGVITVKSAQPGQIVSPQFSGGGGIATIVDMGSLEVDVDVSENFISRVHAKQPATITLNAYPDWHIPAEVIAIVPTADRSKATVQVRVAFKQRDPRILPEMGARVSFVDDNATATARSTATAAVTASSVPTEAVETDGENSAVFEVEGPIVHRRVVQLGQKDGSRQTILSGLAPGGTVAIGAFAKLHDGVKIRIASEQMANSPR